MLMPSFYREAFLLWLLTVTSNRSPNDYRTFILMHAFDTEDPYNINTDKNGYAFALTYPRCPRPFGPKNAAESILEWRASWSDLKNVKPDYGPDSPAHEDQDDNEQSSKADEAAGSQANKRDDAGSKSDENEEDQN